MDWVLNILVGVILVAYGFMAMYNTVTLLFWDTKMVKRWQQYHRENPFQLRQYHYITRVLFTVVVFYLAWSYLFS